MLNQSIKIVSKLRSAPELDFAAQCGATTVLSYTAHERVLYTAKIYVIKQWKVFLYLVQNSATVKVKQKKKKSIRKIVFLKYISLAKNKVIFFDKVILSHNNFKVNLRYNMLPT